VSHHNSDDGKQSARRAIKSFLGVQGAIFQKSPLAAGGKIFLQQAMLLTSKHLYKE